MKPTLLIKFVAASGFGRMQEGAFDKSGLWSIDIFESIHAPWTQHSSHEVWLVRAFGERFLQASCTDWCVLREFEIAEIDVARGGRGSNPTTLAWISRKESTGNWRFHRLHSTRLKSGARRQIRIGWDARNQSGSDLDDFLFHGASDLDNFDLPHAQVSCAGVVHIRRAPRNLQIKSCVNLSLPQLLSTNVGMLSRDPAAIITPYNLIYFSRSNVPPYSSTQGANSAPNTGMHNCEKPVCKKGGRFCNTERPNSNP
jgi:hypothetical protein